MLEFEQRVKYYQKLFGLDNWKITVYFNPNQVDNHNAKTLANPTYNVATMTVYPQLVGTPSVWNEIIVHELIHVVMALYDFFTDNMAKPDTDELFFIARENSVSQLTAIMMRLLNSQLSDNEALPKER